jgi:glycolate oxidase FAD binding subunit
MLFGLPDEFAVEVLCTAMASPFEVSGAVHLQAALAGRLAHPGLRSQGLAVTALRIENFAKSVAYRKGRLKELLKVYGAIMELDRQGSLQLWGELGRLSVLANGDGPVWRISTPPTAGPKVVAAISSLMPTHAFYDWSGGLVWAELPHTTDAGAADVRRAIASVGGHATLIRAEPHVRAGVDVFQPLEAGPERLSRRLKAAFDPAGILNPGRMYAGM